MIFVNYSYKKRRREYDYFGAEEATYDEDDA